MTLKRSEDLTLEELEAFAESVGRTADDFRYVFQHLMLENEAGELVIISTEVREEKTTWTVTTLLDSGWMREQIFLLDGTVKVRRTI